MTETQLELEHAYVQAIDGGYARILADSRSPAGVRLTTVEVKIHRFVLAEWNTHCVLSRNSASSRAIPLKKMMDRAVNETAYPVVWPAEQSGMQGGQELPEEIRERAKGEWDEAVEDAVLHARRLGELGVHKSLANRLMEPFQWHTIIATATAWQNFFRQRCDEAAQPEIRQAAKLVEAAMEGNESQGKIKQLGLGDWHLPLIDGEDLGAGLSLDELTKISSARCARVSYMTHEGKRDHGEDLKLYEKLVGATPQHWSPLEHVATPWAENFQDTEHAFLDRAGTWQEFNTEHLPRVGKLLGWRTLRTEVEAAQGAVTFQ
jgi:thymidylate synthase ThyX